MSDDLIDVCKQMKKYDYQSNFKRIEIKYFLTPEQKEKVLLAINDRMELDKYGRTVILNVYYDTDTFVLARRSIEHPLYKEKLRLRMYKGVKSESSIYVEIKKKYKGIVYKRRIQTIWEQIENNIFIDTDHNSQINQEIKAMFDRYDNLKPMLFLSYEREAYRMKDGSELRLTLDNNIKYRCTDLDFFHGSDGIDILPETTLMEIKTGISVPLWLTNILSSNKIYKTSFSKYGTAYCHMYDSIRRNYRDDKKSNK